MLIIIPNYLKTLFMKENMKTNRIQGQAQTGLFEEDIETYHNTEAVSSTLLREFLKSPFRFWDMWTNKEDKPTSDAFVIGEAFHGLILEPEQFKDRFQLIPNINRRTKAGKEEYENLLANCGDRTLISDDQMGLVNKMADSMLSSTLAKSLLDETKRELTARVGLSNDLLVQCRPDAIKAGHIIDLKTTKDMVGFESSVRSYGYHLQAAMYYFILSAIDSEYEGSDFYFIAVEKSSPYETRVFKIDNQTLEVIIEDKIKPALFKIKELLDDPSQLQQQEPEVLNIL